MNFLNDKKSISRQMSRLHRAVFYSLRLKVVEAHNTHFKHTEKQAR